MSRIVHGGCDTRHHLQTRLQYDNSGRWQIDRSYWQRWQNREHRHEYILDTIDGFEVKTSPKWKHKMRKMMDCVAHGNRLTDTKHKSIIFYLSRAARLPLRHRCAISIVFCMLSTKQVPFVHLLHTNWHSHYIQQQKREKILNFAPNWRSQPILFLPCKSQCWLKIDTPFFFCFLFAKCFRNAKHIQTKYIYFMHYVIHGSNDRICDDGAYERMGNVVATKTKIKSFNWNWSRY